jgi:hypothetical protein
VNPRQALQTTFAGCRAAPPFERASFKMLAAFAATIGISRAINYLRERNRRAPGLRSWTRRAYHAPGSKQLRVHHFLPRIGIAFAAGGAAILTRNDRREFWLSIPFGTGAGLTLDEIGLLVKADNPYWRSENVAFAQGAGAALGAAMIGIRFSRARSTAPCAGRGASGPSAGLPAARRLSFLDLAAGVPSGRISMPSGTWLRPTSATAR